MKLLEKSIAVMRPSDVSVTLARARDTMLRSLIQLLSIGDASNVEYLAPIIEFAQEQESLTIATLNYDQTIEIISGQMGTECDTGIETWLSRGEFGWTTSGLRLLKLHGSIDWVIQEEREARQLPVAQVHKVANAGEIGWYDRPAVVFGETGKLKSEGPYLELLLAFAAELRQAQNLLIVGYSFRDQHVNEVITRWFNVDPEHRIILVDPSDLRGAEPFSFIDSLARLDRHSTGGRLRFEHIVATAKEGLSDGLRAARVADITDDSAASNSNA